MEPRKAICVKQAVKGIRGLIYGTLLVVAFWAILGITLYYTFRR